MNHFQGVVKESNGISLCICMQQLILLIFTHKQTLNITVGNSETDESLNGLDLKQNTSIVVIMMTASEEK